MDIDLTPVVEALARNEFRNKAAEWRPVLEKAILTAPPEERLKMTADLEAALDYDNLPEIDKHHLREKFMGILNIAAPIIKEQIIGQIRMKIELNELVDPAKGTFVASGTISTTELRKLIGEQR